MALRPVLWVSLASGLAACAEAGAPGGPVPVAARDGGGAVRDGGETPVAPDGGEAGPPGPPEFPKYDAGAPPEDAGALPPADAGSPLPPGDPNLPTSGGCRHPPLGSPTASQEGLAPGPVVRYTAKVMHVIRADGRIRRDAFQENGRWIVYRGESVLLDSTQKNVQNQICRWQGEPDWTLQDYSCAYERLEIDNPFLLWVRARRVGLLKVWGRIDGVRSNDVWIESR